MRLCIVLLFWLLAQPVWAAESPERSLAGVQLAIDRHDFEMFEKYVDVRGLVAKGVDAFIADFAANPPGGEGDPLMEMLSGGLASHSQTPASQYMKEILVEETRKFVIRGVASGSFAGQPSKKESLPDGGLLSALFADVSTARKELHQITVRSVSGDKASASAWVYDHGSERGYPLRLGLKRQPQGHWRVTDVSNMGELIRLIRREAEAR